MTRQSDHVRRTLCISQRASVGLDPALNDAMSLLGTPVVGLFYSPDRCFLAAWNGGWQTMDGHNLSNAFEARIFGDSGELRWRHDPDAQAGVASVLSESPFVNQSLWKQTSHENLITIDQSYLPWGEWVQDRSPPGWQTRTSSRIGKLKIPHIEPDVRLLAREYLATDPKHGNTYVLAERYVGFVHPRDLERRL